MHKASNNPLFNLFKSTKAVTLTANNPLITVLASDSLSLAWSKIIQNSILSVPVLTEKGIPVGFLDVIDILTFFFAGNIGEKLTTAKCGDVVNYSEGDTFLRVVETADVWTAAHVMVDFGKLHRVPIIKGDTMVGQVSQTDIIRWIQPFIEENEVGNRTVAETGLGACKEVVKIGKDRPLKEAFQLILHHNVSGIAVTGSLGELYGNISATDLGYLDTVSDLSKLEVSIDEFLKKVPPNPVFGYNPVFVTPSDSVRIMFRKIVEAGVHRVFVVEAAMKLRGIISLVDIITYLLHEATH